MCYPEQRYCAAHCGNTGCGKHHTNAPAESDLPINYSDFSKGCKEFVHQIATVEQLTSDGPMNIMDYHEQLDDALRVGETDYEDMDNDRALILAVLKHATLTTGERQDLLVEAVADCTALAQHAAQQNWGEYGHAFNVYLTNSKWLREQIQTDLDERASDNRRDDLEHAAAAGSVQARVALQDTPLAREV